VDEFHQLFTSYLHDGGAAGGAEAEYNGATDAVSVLLTATVLRQLTVGPAMKLLLEHQLPPAMHQPHFTIAIVSDTSTTPSNNGRSAYTAPTSVRVITDGFVGLPVSGPADPSKKCTPYRVRIITSNLVQPAQPQHADTAGAVPGIDAVPNSIRFAATSTAAISVLDLLSGDEHSTALRQAVSSGEWGAYLRLGTIT
jgi:hypothetical protein